MKFDRFIFKGLSSMVRKSSELKEIRKSLRNICPLNTKDQAIIDNLNIDRDEKDKGWYINTKTSKDEKIIGYYNDNMSTD